MDISTRVEGMDGPHLIFAAVFSVANRLQRVLDSLMPQITTRQWWLLVILSLFDKPPTLTELSKAADTSHQNTRQILNKLVEKGFIHIIPDPSDVRAYRIVTTDLVSQWGAETSHAADELMRAMYAGIEPQDIETVGSSLIRIHQNLGHIEQGEQ